MSEQRIVVDCAGLESVAEAIQDLAGAVGSVAGAIDGLSGRAEGKNYLLGCAQMIEELGLAVRKTTWVAPGKDGGQ